MTGSKLPLQLYRTNKYVAFKTLPIMKLFFCINY